LYYILGLDRVGLLSGGGTLGLEYAKYAEYLKNQSKFLIRPTGNPGTLAIRSWILLLPAGSANKFVSFIFTFWQLQLYKIPVANGRSSMCSLPV